MTDESPHHTNHADESVRSEAGAVTQVIRFEGGGIDRVANLLIVLILAFVLTIPLSIWAVVKVELYQSATNEQIHELRTDARLAAYWGERAEVAMTARGIDMPPYPARKPKEKQP